MTSADHGADVGAAQRRPRHEVRDDSTVQGHMLLARLGKRVLRPGGLTLTTAMLDHVPLTGSDVVELAPGLGRTATEIIHRGPGTYTGIDQDPGAVAAVNTIVQGHGAAHVGTAADTGLDDACADVVVGEAMLTMQSEDRKREIVSEAVRLLRPGGKYAIHELGLMPETLDEAVKSDIQRSLAKSIRVNARPLTIGEWRQVLADAGLEVEWVRTAPMALLQPRRLLADEGLFRTLRFIFRVLTRPDARRRVVGMRRTFRRHRDHLIAVSLVARRPG